MTYAIALSEDIMHARKEGGVWSVHLRHELTWIFLSIFTISERKWTHLAFDLCWVCGSVNVRTTKKISMSEKWTSNEPKPEQTVKWFPFSIAWAKVARKVKWAKKEKLAKWIIYGLIKKLKLKYFKGLQWFIFFNLSEYLNSTSNLTRDKFNVKLFPDSLMTRKSATHVIVISVSHVMWMKQLNLLLLRLTEHNIIATTRPPTVASLTNNNNNKKYNMPTLMS